MHILPHFASRSAYRNIVGTAVFTLALFGILFAPFTPIADAAGYKVSSGATFNDPFGSTSAKWRIINKIAGAIDHAPKGSTIRIAVYSITIDKIADKLIAAHKRGVNVRIVTDDHLYDTENDAKRDALTEQIERLKKELGTKTSESSFVKICDHGCMSDNEYASMHAKLYMFSTSGTSKNVAMLSSSNPSTTHTNAWNNLYTFTGNAEMYNSLKDYFEAMAKEPDKTKDWYSNVQIGSYRLYTFPRKTANTLDEDVQYTMLQNIACTGLAKGYGTKPDDPKASRTIVDVAMFKITSARLEVAQQIDRLARQGCLVRVALSRESTPDDVIAALLKSGKVQVRDMDVWKKVKDPVTGKTERVVYNYTHDKYWAINGKYDGDSSSYIVFTGSPNITSAGLRYNNEIMVRLYSKKDYSAYHSNFGAMWKKGQKIQLVDMK
jgi:phosphatidylserine/phosphatidylglycerophosphate/cardiolipin synthase-like enzyme